MNEKANKVLRIGLSILLSLSAVIFLGLLGFALKDDAIAVYKKMKIVAVILLIVIIALLIGNLVLVGIYMKKKTSGRAKEIRDNLLSQSEEIRGDYLKAEKAVTSLRLKSSVYIVFLVYAFAYISLFALDETIVFALASFWFFMGVFGRYSWTSVVNFSEYEKRENYPEIYAIAERAAKTVGVSGEVKILFTPDMDAAIGKFGRKISLRLGVRLLAFFREEELYAILLHEFAHLKNEYELNRTNHRFYDFLHNEDGMGFTGFNGLFVFPAAVYGYHLAMYEVMASVVIEGVADQTMVHLGDKQTAANALAKLAVFDRFYARVDFYMGRPPMADEECSKNFGREIYERFLQLLPEKQEEWLHLTEVELQARSASHPIIRTRIQNMGVDSYEITPPESEGAYFEESRRAFSAMDEKLYEWRSQDYAKNREEEYLTPLKKVTDWEEGGRVFEREQVREVIGALTSLNRYDDALSLCEEIFAREGEDSGLSLFALFARGHIRLDLLDKRGIDDLYAASESNRNYVDSAMERIGEFCCAMGLEKELEEYRERSLYYMQREMDEEGSSKLLASDNLSEETSLPQEIQERNKAKILEAGKGHITHIYLLRKQVTEKYAYSAYVIRFDKNILREGVAENMDEIWMYLDSTPEDWNYSLFLYDRTTIAAVKKVANSCIYQRDKGM